MKTLLTAMALSLSLWGCGARGACGTRSCCGSKQCSSKPSAKQCDPAKCTMCKQKGCTKTNCKCAA